MNAPPNGTMDDVLRLTKAGRLSEALTLLRGGGATVHQPSPRPAAGAGLRGLVDLIRSARKDDAGIAGFGTTGAQPTNDGAHEAAGAAQEVRPGSFDVRTLRNAAGSRRYKLYVPTGPLEGALPLVVMLHGCTQSPDDFAAGTRMNAIAEELRVVVVYPEQRRSANSSKCWNWFKPGDQQRDRGEPSIIADIVRQITRDLPIDANRVFVAGLSAGGAAAVIMGHEYPDLVAGVGVHSGLACGSARDLSSALAAMQAGAVGLSPGTSMPTIIFHGTADRTVNPLNAGSVLKQASPDAREGEVVHGQSEGGVDYTQTVFGHDGGGAAELWMLSGAGHAWSGGSSAGSYTDPRGPDASREMMRFFLSLRLGDAR